MFTRIALTIIATAMLGAGAYAVVPAKPAPVSLIPANITVIEKNQAWPLKGNISLDPCIKVYCASA